MEALHKESVIAYHPGGLPRSKMHDGPFLLIQRHPHLHVGYIQARVMVYRSLRPQMLGSKPSDSRWVRGSLFPPEAVQLIRAHPLILQVLPRCGIFCRRRQLLRGYAF